MPLEEVFCGYSCCCCCCCCEVASVVSNSVWPHRRQPTRLRRPGDSPGKNTGVGCYFLLQCRKVKSESEVAQSCLTLGHPMDCSLPDSSAMGFSRQEYWSGVPLPSPLEEFTVVFSLYSRGALYTRYCLCVVKSKTLIEDLNIKKYYPWLQLTSSHWRHLDNKNMLIIIQILSKCWVFIDLKNSQKYCLLVTSKQCSELKAKSDPKH